MVRQLVLGRQSLARGAGEGKLEGGVVPSQVVLQYLGVEGFSSHQPVVQGVGLHDVHG